MHRLEDEREHDAHGRRHRHQRGRDQEPHDEALGDVAGAEVGRRAQEGRGEAAEARAEHEDRHPEAEARLKRAMGPGGVECFGRDVGHGRADRTQTRREPFGRERRQIAIREILGHREPVEAHRDAPHLGHGEARGRGVVGGGQEARHPLLDHERLHGKPQHQQRQRWDGGQQRRMLAVVAGQGMQPARIPARAGERETTAGHEGCGGEDQDGQNEGAEAHAMSGQGKEAARGASRRRGRVSCSAGPSARGSRPFPASWPARDPRRGRRPRAGRRGRPSRRRRRTRYIPAGPGSRRDGRS